MSTTKIIVELEIEGDPSDAESVVDSALDVGGAPFHAVLFKITQERCAKCHGHDSWGWINALSGKPTGRCVDCGHTECEEIDRLMFASVFDARGAVAVVAVEPLSDPAVGVAFGENSWRGDQYEAELRAAIQTHQSDGSVRVGPFSVPTVRAGTKARRATSIPGTELPRKRR